MLETNWKRKPQECDIMNKRRRNKNRKIDSDRCLTTSDLVKRHRNHCFTRSIRIHGRLRFVGDNIRPPIHKGGIIWFVSASCFDNFRRRNLEPDFMDEVDNLNPEYGGESC
jgi:hypothetical protein